MQDSDYCLRHGGINPSLRRKKAGMADQQDDGSRKELLAALERAANVLEALGLLIQAEVDERLVRIEEIKAGVIADALLAALEDAGISGKLSDEVRRDFARRLRKLPPDDGNG